MRENMPELIVLSGLPGSGKTTYAGKLKERGFAVASSDGIRDELFGGKFSLDTNDEVFGILHKRAAELLLSGRDTVIDAVNATPFARMDILFGVRDAMCEAGKWDFAFFSSCVVIETAPPLCLFRNGLRDKPCPEDAFMKMREAFAYPDRREGFSDVKSVYRKMDPGVIAGYSEERKEEMLSVLEKARKSREYTLSGRCRMEAAADIGRVAQLLQKEKSAA